MRKNVKSAMDSGTRFVQDIAESRETISNAIEEGRGAATQFLKETRGSIEDLLGDATRNIKRNPLRSILVAFGAGAFLGMMIARTGRG